MLCTISFFQTQEAYDSSLSKNMKLKNGLALVSLPCNVCNNYCGQTLMLLLIRNTKFCYAHCFKFHLCRDPWYHICTPLQPMATSCQTFPHILGMTVVKKSTWPFCSSCQSRIVESEWTLFDIFRFIILLIQIANWCGAHKHRNRESKKKMKKNIKKRKETEKTRNKT
jgi:hypothetical protein